MLITTTPTIEGRTIRLYHGVVTGEAIIGANFLKDMFAAVRDIVGGRAGAYEKTLRKARETAFADMEAAAQELGANAIVAVKKGQVVKGALPDLVNKHAVDLFRVVQQKAEVARQITAHAAPHRGRGKVGIHKNGAAAMPQGEHLGKSGCHHAASHAAVRAEYGYHAAEPQGAGVGIQLEQHAHGLQKLVHGQGLCEVLVRSGGKSLPVEAEIIFITDGHYLDLSRAAFPYFAQQPQRRGVPGNIQNNGAVPQKIRWR